MFFGGSIIIEHGFSILDGMGLRSGINAILNARDYNVIMALIFIQASVLNGRPTGISDVGVSSLWIRRMDFNEW